MADDADRLETLKGMMTPALREAVAAKLKGGKLSRPLLEAVSDGAMKSVTGDAGALETVVPLGALEAIVKLTGRPPLLVHNDKVVLEPLPTLPAGTDAKIVGVQKWIPSVGRVEFINADQKWGGTGWVVESHADGDVIITNRHVAKVVGKRLASGKAVFLSSLNGIPFGARIDFREEQDSAANDASFTIPVDSIRYIADDLAADIALFKLATGGRFRPAPLQLADTEAKVDDLVALIGYPAFDPRNDGDAQAKYFHDLYNVKRFAPGLVSQALSPGQILMHDCTSLGGNSGSPLISLEDGKVIGLHFSGSFGVGNSAVGVETIKKLLAGNVTAGGGTSGGEGVEGLADSAHPAAFYAKPQRQGFDTTFLKGGAIKTPWPKLPAAVVRDLAQPSDHPPEPGELRYTHFGVKYSAIDKLPLMTAVNIDGAHAVRVKRTADRWFADGRIDKALQLGSANFADGQIDRGHMVRREDPNWGPEAHQANDDTFHYVNACAQHSLLNQGKTLWQGLENYILDNARTAGFSACVFTGPLVRETDPEISGAHVPLEFWKVVATLDASGQALRATAYLLSQGQLIRDLMLRRAKTEAVEGVTTLGEYRTFQIAVADLAAATGYDFGPYVTADPLHVTTEAVGGDPVFIPLDDDLSAMRL